MRESIGDPARRPTHPGAILREDVLPALGMTQIEFARLAGIEPTHMAPVSQHGAGTA